MISNNAKHVESPLTPCPPIATKNLTLHLCSMPIDVDDEIVPIFAVFISITLVAVALRVLARVLTKAYFWWDDLCNLFALVGCIAFTAINIQGSSCVCCDSGPSRSNPLCRG